MSKAENHTYRLVIHCPDKVGIVAAVSQFIADHGGWLVESNYHAEPESGWFLCAMKSELAPSVSVLSNSAKNLLNLPQAMRCDGLLMTQCSLKMLYCSPVMPLTV